MIKPMQVAVWTNIARITDDDSYLRFRSNLNEIIDKKVAKGWLPVGGVATDYPLPEEGKIIFIAEGFIRYKLPSLPKNKPITKLQFKLNTAFKKVA